MKAHQIYSRYFVQFLKARMSYRSAFFAGILTDIAASVTGIIYVYLLVDGENVRTLGGWHRYEVLFLFGYSYLSMSLFRLLATNLYGFANRYIIEGQFDRVLLRPLGTLPQVLFESFNLEAVANFLLGLGVIFYSKAQMGWSWGVLDCLWLILSVFSAGVILLSVFISVVSISFFIEDRVGIGAPVFNMISFSRYPIDIFNRGIRFFLTFIIPFAFVSFYPSTHFFERGDFAIYCYSTPIAAVITASVAVWIWSKGIERYSSTGN